MAAPFHQTAPRLCRDDGQESARATMLAEFDGAVDDVKRCVHWLTAMGVAILSVSMRRGPALPLITVAASPYLEHIFGNDYANIGRKRNGELTVYTWSATRHGCLIVWEEACA